MAGAMAETGNEQSNEASLNPIAVGHIPKTAFAMRKEGFASGNGALKNSIDDSLIRVTRQPVPEWRWTAPNIVAVSCNGVGVSSKNRPMSSKRGLSPCIIPARMRIRYCRKCKGFWWFRICDQLR